MSSSKKRLLASLVLLVSGFVLGRLLPEPAALAQGTETAPEQATPPPPSEDHPTQATGEVPAGQPRYLQAMRDELTAMGIDDAACEAIDAQRAQCTLTQRGANSHRQFDLRLAYSDVTDTIYCYVDRYMDVDADHAQSSAVLRRMMELNWQMLLGKFEWDATDGEVRLTMVLNTDSNFDRRAFRSAVRGLGQLGDRYLGELTRLLEPATAGSTGGAAGGAGATRSGATAPE